MIHFKEKCIKNFTTKFIIKKIDINILLSACKNLIYKDKEKFYLFKWDFF